MKAKLENRIAQKFKKEQSLKYQEEFIASIFAGIDSKEFYEQDIK